MAIFAVFEVYWPAIRGPFLLDDSGLPYMLPAYVGLPLRAWISGLRPLLMFSFWLNYQGAGSQDTFGYHLVNVVLHFLNGGLILLAVRRVLSWTRIEKWHADAHRDFRRGTFSAASLADRIGDVCRQPLGDAQRFLGAGSLHCLRVSHWRRDLNAAGARDSGAFRRGGPFERTHRRAARGAAADGFLLEPRILLGGHPAQLEAVRPHRCRRCGGSSASYRAR